MHSYIYYAHWERDNDGTTNHIHKILITKIQSDDNTDPEVRDKKLNRYFFGTLNEFTRQKLSLLVNDDTTQR